MYSHVGHDLPLLLELLMPVVFTIVIVFCLGEPWVIGLRRNQVLIPRVGLTTGKSEKQGKKGNKKTKPLLSRLHCQADATEVNDG
jgi:hypothetical protein